MDDIPGFKDFISVEPVTKGWSEDKKFCVTKTDGVKYLLRISPASRYLHRERLFAAMKQVEALGVPMCRPVDFGPCRDGVYMLQSWIDGEDAEEVLPTLSETEQYALGYESGELLRKIHSIPAPESQEEWAVRFGRKTDIKMEKYRACGVRFEGDEGVIDYLVQNRHLLWNRPQCFQHGDYHVGNMMIERGKLVIIDFDRYDYGDPWEEFNRIVWSATASPHFATGQFVGYFGGSPSMEFFRLLMFYIACNTLSSIYWAMPFGQSELSTMMNQSQDVLRWYDNMRNPVPSWFLSDYNAPVFCDIRHQFDDPRVLAVYAGCMYMPNEQKLKTRAGEIMEDDSTYAFACKSGDDILGVAAVKLESCGDAVLKGIAVSPENRGGGIGSGLIRYAMERLQLRTLCAETDDDAVNFYRKIGFEIEDLGFKYENTRRYKCTLKREALKP